MPELVFLTLIIPRPRHELQLDGTLVAFFFVRIRGHFIHCALEIGLQAAVMLRVAQSAAPVYQFAQLTGFPRLLYGGQILAMIVDVRRI
jgi:hypothetical protein